MVQTYQVLTHGMQAAVPTEYIELILGRRSSWKIHPPHGISLVN